MKTIIATHKPYRIPSDPVSLPLHVGAELEMHHSNAGDRLN